MNSASAFTAPARSRVRIGLLLAGSVMTCSLLAPDLAHAATSAVADSASHQSNAAVRWGLVLGFGISVLVLIMLALTGARMLVIGQDNRLSTSKTIAVVWTLVVAAALTALVYAGLLNHPQALNATNASGVVGQYAVLFGGPLGAAIAAKGIVTKQVGDNPSLKSPASGASLTDLVSDDAGNTDLGDFQYVLFNAVALFFVIGMLITHPSSGLPHIPDVLLGLTSVSAAGYVGKKAVTPTGVVTGSLKPDHGQAGTQIQIAVAALTPPSEPRAPMWVRFGDLSGAISAADVVGGATTLVSTAPQLLPPPKQPVNVSVITANGTFVDVGTFRYD